MPARSNRTHPRRSFQTKRRNAAPAAFSRRRRTLRRAPAPDFSTTIASVAGGGGGAVLGGILANQEILSPETVGLALTVGGAISGYCATGSCV